MTGATNFKRDDILLRVDYRASPLRLFIRGSIPNDAGPEPYRAASFGLYIRCPCGNADPRTKRYQNPEVEALKVNG